MRRENRSVRGVVQRLDSGTELPMHQLHPNLRANSSSLQSSDFLSARFGEFVDASPHRSPTSGWECPEVASVSYERNHDVQVVTVSCVPQLDIRNSRTILSTPFSNASNLRIQCSLGTLSRLTLSPRKGKAVVFNHDRQSGRRPQHPPNIDPIRANA